jgi:hypothetical protein
MPLKFAIAGIICALFGGAFIGYAIRQSKSNSDILAAQDSIVAKNVRIAMLDGQISRDTVEINRYKAEIANLSSLQPGIIQEIKRLKNTPVAVKRIVDSSEVYRLLDKFSEDNK